MCAASTIAKSAADGWDSLQKVKPRTYCNVFLKYKDLLLISTRSLTPFLESSLKRNQKEFSSFLSFSFSFIFSFFIFSLFLSPKNFFEKKRESFHFFFFPFLSFSFSFSLYYFFLFLSSQRKFEKRGIQKSPRPTIRNYSIISQWLVMFTGTQMWSEAFQTQHTTAHRRHFKL